MAATPQAGSNPDFFVPYTEMVEAITGPSSSGARSLLRAMVGMRFTVSRVMAASRADQLLEEFGDMEFFVEAAHQSLAIKRVERVTPEPDKLNTRAEAFYMIASALETLTMVLTTAAAAVAPGELSQQGTEGAQAALRRVEYMLEQLYHITGVDSATVKQISQEKWARIWPGRVYALRPQPSVVSTGQIAASQNDQA